MDFNKNDMINETLDKYFETWQHTQDTSDFVDEKFLKRVDKYIFKNLVKQFRRIDVYSLLMLQDKGVKLGLVDKFRVWFSPATPIYKAEKRELERIKEEKRKRAEEKKKREEEQRLKRRRKK